MCQLDDSDFTLGAVNLLIFKQYIYILNNCQSSHYVQSLIAIIYYV